MGGLRVVIDETELLRQRVKDLEESIARLKKAPAPRALVLQIGEDVTVVGIGGAVQEVSTPKHDVGEGFEVGAWVNIDPQTRGILKVVEDMFHVSQVRTVRRVVDDRHVEVNAGNESAVVLYAPKAAPFTAGDRVQLDPSGLIVTRNLGPEPSSAPMIETGIHWDDVGGLDEPRAQLREAIEGHVRDGARYARYGRQPSKGALLSGPAGCGKTLLAKAAATALAELHGKKHVASGFVYVAGPELLNRFVGESEAGVRRLFREAREHHKAHGYPAIICLDEADGLLAKRGSSNWEGMEKTIVPQFLAEMDGMGSASAFVIVCTNRPDMIDPAIARDKRLDLKIAIKRPTRETAVPIARVHLRGRPLEGMDVDQAATTLVEELYAERHCLYMLRTKSGKGDRRFTLGELASGASIAGLVDRAIDRALLRDRRTQTDGGIRAEDLAAAADLMTEEQRALDHTGDLEIAAEATGADFKTFEYAT